MTMKILTAILTFLLLVSCGLRNKSEKVLKTSNSAYCIERLFTIDGITVYRFYDGNKCAYFTNRTGKVEYVRRRKAGKTISRERVQIICNSYDCIESGH